MATNLGEGTKSVPKIAQDPHPPRDDFSRIVGEHANLKVHESNIHNRVAMDTCNRSVPFYVMSYMKEGSSTLRCRGREYEVGAGEVLIVPARAAHDHVMNRSSR